MTPRNLDKIILSKLSLKWILSWDLCLWVTGYGLDPWSGRAGSQRPLPQLHDTAHIPRGEDPPDVVEVSHKDAAIGSAGQSQGGQQLVALRLPVTAGAGDAAAAAVSWKGSFLLTGTFRFWSLNIQLPNDILICREVSSNFLKAITSNMWLSTLARRKAQGTEQPAKHIPCSPFTETFTHGWLP